MKSCSFWILRKLNFKKASWQTSNVLRMIDKYKDNCISSVLKTNENKEGIFSDSKNICIGNHGFNYNLIFLSCAHVQSNVNLVRSSFECWIWLKLMLHLDILDFFLYSVQYLSGQ